MECSIHEEKKDYVRCGLKNHRVRLLDDIYVCDWICPVYFHNLVGYQLEPATSFPVALGLLHVSSHSFGSFWCSFVLFATVYDLNIFFGQNVFLCWEVFECSFCIRPWSDTIILSNPLYPSVVG